MRYLIYVVFLVILPFGANAFGGLYYCPESKEAFFIDWDGSSANAVYWSQGGRNLRRVEIMTQYREELGAQGTDQTYFIQIWEMHKPNVSYELHFHTPYAEAIPTITMNRKGSGTQTLFIALGGEFELDPDAPFARTLASALLHGHWFAQDAETGFIVKDFPILREYGSQEDRFRFVMGDGEGGTEQVPIDCHVQPDLTIRVATTGFEDYSIVGKLNIYAKAQLRLSFYAPTGDHFLTLVQNGGDAYFTSLVSFFEGLKVAVAKNDKKAVAHFFAFPIRDLGADHDVSEADFMRSYDLQINEVFKESINNMMSFHSFVRPGMEEGTYLFDVYGLRKDGSRYAIVYTLKDFSGMFLFTASEYY
ncbi:MAG: hypothetical protein ACFCUI_04635 [Bernardetiaceae bacterium]